MTYRRVFKISRTTGATSGAETSLPFPSNLVHPQFLGGPLFVFHCPFSFYHCIVFLSLYCLFIIVLSFYHCIVFLSLYCLFIIVLSFYHWFVFLSLYCLSFFDLWLMIISLISSKFSCNIL
jgi:hypothetical protein